MDNCTTHFDVLEDSLGFRLSPENQNRLRDLQVEDFHRLANDVENHVKSDYFKVPTVDDVVGFCSPGSEIGQRLGAYSNQTGRVIGGTTESIVGSVYCSLLTHSRLALPDGLQYLLE